MVTLFLLANIKPAVALRSYGGQARRVVAGGETERGSLGDLDAADRAHVIAGWDGGAAGAASGRDELVDLAVLAALGVRGGGGRGRG